MPPSELELHLPSMLGGLRADQLAHGLDLLARSCVGKYLIVVGRDGHAVLKAVLERVLEVRGLEPLAQLIRAAIALEADAQPPIVCHGRGL